MKKCVALFLMSVMLLSVAGCGGKSSGKTVEIADGAVALSAGFKEMAKSKEFECSQEVMESSVSDGLIQIDGVIIDLTKKIALGELAYAFEQSGAYKTNYSIPEEASSFNLPGENAQRRLVEESEIINLGDYIQLTVFREGDPRSLVIFEGRTSRLASSTEARMVPLGKVSFNSIDYNTAWLARGAVYGDNDLPTNDVKILKPILKDVEALKEYKYDYHAGLRDEKDYFEISEPNSYFHFIRADGQFNTIYVKVRKEGADNTLRYIFDFSPYGTQFSYASVSIEQ